MDTSHMEYTAEDLISHKLSRAGLLVAKPKFDRDGADLLGFMNVKKGTKFCRIQCKGRSLINSKSSNVEVLKNYVSGAFVLFLFIDDGSKDATNLFCFFTNDIERNWKLKTHEESSKDFYRLSFSRTSFNKTNEQQSLLKYSVTEDKIEEIKSIIKNSDSEKEFDKMFDLIKQQEQLLKLQKEHSELQLLINKIKHIDEVKAILKDKIKIMEAHYDNLKLQDEANNQLNQ